MEGNRAEQGPGVDHQARKKKSEITDVSRNEAASVEIRGAAFSQQPNTPEAGMLLFVWNPFDFENDFENIFWPEDYHCHSLNYPLY